MIINRTGNCMKAIFLDIDGVLNNASTTDSVFGCVGIDDVLIKRLKKIVAATSAEIYLISTWKDRWYKDADKKCLQDIFADHLDAKFYEYGLKITDKLENEGINPDARGKLIKEFLEHNEVQSFVILDDVEFDYFYEHLENNFIQTDSKFGLTEEDVKKAIEILEK